MRAVNEKFVDLGLPRRIWAVAAINGDIERLTTLHDHLATRFNTRDRLVYLGNYLGSGNNNEAVIDELLAFRSAILTKSGTEPQDIAHLRGPAEEAWQKLLRLQFAPVPTQTLEKLINAGVDAYLRLYDISMTDTKAIARAGSVAITRWTNQLRLAQRLTAGHEALTCSMRRAAVTRPTHDGGERLLFVPAGFDSSRSLEDQGENLWDSTLSFSSADHSAASYARIVRGFDSNRGGVDTSGTAVTLDGGCGRGGPLVCGCFNAAGQLTEIVAVGGQGAIENLPLESRKPLIGSSLPKPSFAEPISSGRHWTNQIAASA